MSRQSHYELAFEAYLTDRRTTYVAVEEMRRAVPGRPGIKLFDYIIYGVGGTNFLVDVKGRKVGERTRSRDTGLETWVTAADVAGLTEWQSIFGPGFVAAFVFAHWRSGAAVGEADGLFDFAGRRYTFQVVPLADYQAHQRQRSPRWRTVCLPRETFRRFALRPEQVWGAAATNTQR